MEKVRIWQISGSEITQIKKTKLDFETRIETWIEKDISVISDRLLIIGKQVQTDYGGLIDLICLDSNGDIVILELKRNKTPRDVTAQILDYASWVDELQDDRIYEIANTYLKTDLNETFKQKFKLDLPEALNNNHSMLVVASEIDDSTERIVKYLSNKYGVDINVIQFHYFRQNDEEFLVRSMLLEPEEVEKKQARNNIAGQLTRAQCQKIADDKGLGRYSVN